MKIETVLRDFWEREDRDTLVRRNKQLRLNRIRKKLRSLERSVFVQGYISGHKEAAEGSHEIDVLIRANEVFDEEAARIGLEID